jgi:hypothetical protein
MTYMSIQLIHSTEAQAKTIITGNKQQMETEQVGFSALEKHLNVQL